MDEQLKLLKAPPRSDAAQQASKARIAARLQTTKSPWHYYATLVAACLVALLLAGSYFGERSTNTTASGTAIQSIYSLQNYGDEPFAQLDAFYHIDKLRVDEAYYEQFAAILTGLQQSTDQPPSDLGEPKLDFLVTLQDGTEHYIQLYTLQHEYSIPSTVVAPHLDRMLALSDDAAVEMMSALTVQERSLFESFVRLLLGATLVGIVLAVIEKLQLPRRATATKGAANIAVVMFSIIVYYWLISGTSMFVVGTKNGLFMLLGVLPFIAVSLARYSKTKDRGHLTDIVLYLAIAIIIIFVFQG